MIGGFSSEKPFTHDLVIRLRGSLDPNDPDNEDLPMPPGVPNVGWKAIGGYCKAVGDGRTLLDNAGSMLIVLEGYERGLEGCW